MITAAALAEFAARSVDAAVVEAGLGGRHDATNVLAAPVVVLTNVALEHTEVLGDTREAIAAEKLAVVTPGSHVVLGEPEWEPQAREAGAATVEIVSGSNLALAVAAAAALLGDRVDPSAAEAVRVPGRLERRSEHPLEIWDGAHNLAGIGYLLARLPSREYTLVVSILADKDADEMLRALTALGGTFVATAVPKPACDPGRRPRGARETALRPGRIGRRSGRRSRPRSRARRARRGGACDRIALLARGAIARWLEPVPFRRPVGAPASSSSPSSSSPSTLGLHSQRVG